MTVTSAVDPAPPSADPAGVVAGDGTSARDRAAARWGRWRWPLAVGSIVLLIAALTALTVPRGEGGDLDPRNPGRTGTRAVAEILRAQGVTVQRVTRSTEAAAGATAGSTLVVVQPGLLGPEQVRRLRDVPADGHLVLVRPDAVTLQTLAPAVRPSGVLPAQVREPGCALPAARAAGPARAGGAFYEVTGTAAGRAVTCYAAPDGRTPYVRLRTGGRTVTVIGQPDLLTNEHLASDGNAALALRTLGEGDRLVWYVPDPLEMGTGEDPPALSELVPDRTRWAAVQLTLAAGVALLWRGRRLGPLVPEPLPVVVRSAETQEGRARLYRQARARGRAAATLRTAALRRLAGRLAVPAGTTPEDVARLVAAAQGRREDDVRAVLLGPAPEDDDGLVRLADELDALELGIRTSAERDPRP